MTVRLECYNHFITGHLPTEYVDRGLRILYDTEKKYLALLQYYTAL